MTMLNLSGRSANMGPKLLLSCLLLCLLMSGQAAAQDKNVTCTGADLGSYAELGFCLAPEVTTEAESINEANYTSGREVKASLLLNGSRVVLHLLYPCQPPQSLLDATAMRSLLDAYNPAMIQAGYSNETFDILGLPALVGIVENQVFISYQPTNQTIALVLLDRNISEEILGDFVNSLRITLKEGTSPLIAGYCPDTTATTTTPAATTQVDTQTAAANALANSQVATQTTPAETREAAFESKKEKMASDKEAAIARLEATKERLRRY